MPFDRGKIELFANRSFKDVMMDLPCFMQKISGHKLAIFFQEKFYGLSDEFMILMGQWFSAVKVTFLIFRKENRWKFQLSSFYLRESAFSLNFQFTYFLIFPQKYEFLYTFHIFQLIFFGSIYFLIPPSKSPKNIWRMF